MSHDIEKNLNQIKELLSGGNFGKSSDEASSENSGSNSTDTLKNIINLFGKQGQNSDSNRDSSESEHNSGIPFDTDTLQMFMKIKQVMEKSQKNGDPREKLLLALKPYLNDKRKDKIAECINLLKMTNIFETFSSLEGGEGSGKSRH